MIHYLDTSVAVLALEGVPEAVTWFDRATEHDDLHSSRLLQTEVTRVLRRLGRPVVERDWILDSVAIVAISDGVLSVAESITEHVKTLDSIHLATALSLGAQVTVVSHDAGMLRVADTLGLRTLDPLLGP